MKNPLAARQRLCSNNAVFVSDDVLLRAAAITEVQRCSCVGVFPRLRCAFVSPGRFQMIEDLSCEDVKKCYRGSVR